MGIQQVFAENMRKYRKRAHMTQEDLAEKSGLHRTYIGGIEQRRINVSLKNVEKIARALEIDPALLFMRESEISQQDSPHEGHQQEALAKGGYALCTWANDGMVIEPLSVHDESLSIGILCSLINDGHTDDLAVAYEKTQAELLRYFREERGES